LPRQRRKQKLLTTGRIEGVSLAASGRRATPLLINSRVT
jgi:hypothetical protein